MKIELKEISIQDLTKGYEDKQEDGVVGFNGKLDIRPPFQREFIYKPQQRDAVITTVKNDFPLNVMYWSVREDKNFEVIDGQQRTISICQYVNGDFSYKNRYFHNLKDNEKNQILKYKLLVYLCSGTDSEKLDWFKSINIAGEELTPQELRNAVYAGSWVTDAKRHFSKNGCPAYSLGNQYMSGAAIRQEYMETAIKWISKGEIEPYMAKNQHKNKAEELWVYFQSVIGWVKNTFPKYRNEMKGVNWGDLYNEFSKKRFDAKKLENEVAMLMEDEDVDNKRGIYSFVIDRKEKHLNIRSFSPKQKREAFERQKGKCPKCKKVYQIEEMEADHIKPWHEGGRTAADNCQMLCKEDNRKKAGK